MFAESLTPAEACGELAELLGVLSRTEKFLNIWAEEVFIDLIKQEDSLKRGLKESSAGHLENILIIVKN